jgi:hypothetical protein
MTTVVLGVAFYLLSVATAFRFGWACGFQFRDYKARTNEAHKA